MNNELKMIAGVIVLCVLLLGAFIWSAPKGGVNNVVKDLSILVKENSRMTGDINAKVTLVEFSDFQCPACASVAPYIKAITDSYADNPDFNFVYRYFPLTQHSNAVISAEAVESAGAQGKYWEMFELIFANQSEWASVSKPIDIFVGYAQTLGLNTVQFKQDIEQDKFNDLIMGDLRDSQVLGITGTPTFFLNGVQVTDLSSLKAQIDSALVQ